MLDLQDKIDGIVFGLCYGEGIAFPSATHRLGILAPKRIARMKTLGEFADDQKQTTRPFPYTHAQPGHMLNPSPADDTEWFAFVADYLLKQENAETVWLDLANKRDEIKARTGTKIALKNLFEGKSPPATGQDNPHYFDDISLVRAIAIAIIHHREPEKMNSALTKDILVTHSEDGFYCADAVARLVANLLRGEGIESAVHQAMNALPKGSWSENIVGMAVSASRDVSNTIERASVLEINVVENVYAYPVSAPETLGLLIAHLINTSNPQDLIFSSLLHKRKLDSLPPLAGAIAGAIFGSSWLPKSAKSEEIKLDGVCLPSLKSLSLHDLANRLKKAS